jgi:hypothetical protein
VWDSLAGVTPDFWRLEPLSLLINRNSNIRLKDKWVIHINNLNLWWVTNSMEQSPS